MKKKLLPIIVLILMALRTSSTLITRKWILLENMKKNERTISIAAQNVHYILEGTVERVPAAHRDGLQIT